ncbi:MAG: hypothetical protein M1816_007080 [Peltula sp. TS41687]|nr:MAG: hypothetical protein M1816_007080 [Peltula sp. TS41687]
MTDKLPPNLLALFAPRPALRYLPHGDHASEDRKTATITGVAQYLDKLKEPDEYTPTESWLERRDRKKLEKKEKQEKLLTEGFKEFDPAKDQQVRGDPYRTLFVARLSYDTKEADLEREFGRFGPIERIRIVTNPYEDDKTPKKNRGYAFIVYERERDMKGCPTFFDAAAYKETDGIRIKDRRVLVDVERGRTVKGWRPRRYGGGLGGRGYTKTAPPRPAGPLGLNAPAGPGGGFRGGGFRGGFAGGRGGFRDGPPRGGFAQGRGGIGYQGGGGFGRGGYGGQSNGFNGAAQAPPPNAPSGPSGNRAAGGYAPGGYGSSSSYGGGGTAAPYGEGAPNGSRTDAGGYGDSRGGRSYDDSRSSYRGSRPYPDGGDNRMGAGSGSNREPVRPRDGGGQRDRDRDRDRDGGYSSRHKDEDYSTNRKRHHEDDRHDDPRQRRRY